MKIQGNAFYFGEQADSTDAKFGNFFGWLQSLQATPSTNWPPHKSVDENTAFRRELFVNTSDDLFYGVVLSARTNKFQHFVRRVGAHVTIESRTAGANPPVEVNCFCLRRDSNKGMYSHYYGSYAFMSFLGDLWNAYRHFVKHQQSIALSRPGRNDDEDALAAQFSLRSRAKWSVLCSRENFERLVRHLREVWEVRLTTYDIDAPEDQPMKNRINNVHSTYRMKGVQHVDTGFLGWLREKRSMATRTLRSGQQSVSGSVLGLNNEGQEKTVFFGDNLDNLLNFSYDDMGAFDVDNLMSNPCIAEMVGKVREMPMFDVG